MARLDQNIDAGFSEIRAEISRLDFKIDTGLRDLEQKMTIKLGALFFAANDLLLTGMRLIFP